VPAVPAAVVASAVPAAVPLVVVEASVAVPAAVVLRAPVVLRVVGAVSPAGGPRNVGLAVAVATWRSWSRPS